jgi:dienelactone hydrolase
MKPCPVIEKAPRLLQLGMIVADHEAPANIRLELVVYPGVHHSFFYPELQPGRKMFGYWLEYNEEAATDATRRMRECLKRHLNSACARFTHACH